ncbi:hypothetical protein GGGNBK_12600 [Sporosarcina sp. ANT_H38]|uniref:hypothetical protein n=1 Tax=Sporosarcina sp. ANT_H38 TaxID=2597358 RepID=UPI00165DA827|nr:hypothetical protein [Sporosarcina sp. ANT_H38]
MIVIAMTEIIMTVTVMTEIVMIGRDVDVTSVIAENLIVENATSVGKSMEI